VAQQVVLVEIMQLLPQAILPALRHRKETQVVVVQLAQLPQSRQAAVVVREQLVKPHQVPVKVGRVELVQLHQSLVPQ
jgi:hypothetical protein